MTKNFPAHHTHTQTYTPHSCPPHTRLGTYLRHCRLWKQLLSRPQPHPASNGHGPTLSAPRPTDLTQRHLYEEPSNKDLHLRLPCSDLILGKGGGPEDPFLCSDSALSPFHAQASLPTTPGPQSVRHVGDTPRDCTHVLDLPSAASCWGVEQERVHAFSSLGLLYYYS